MCDQPSDESINKLCLHLAEQPLDIVIHNAGVQQLRNYFDAKSKAISIQDENMINLTASYLLTEKLFDNVLSSRGTWVYVTSAPEIRVIKTKALMNSTSMYQPVHYSGT